MTAAHLFDICDRMKIVRFDEPPTNFASEQLSHCSFARTRHTQNNYDHNALFCQRLRKSNALVAQQQLLTAFFHKLCYVDRSRDISHYHNSTAALQKEVRDSSTRSE